MNHPFWVASVLLGALVAGGCATVTRGTTQALVIQSQPPDAEVKVSNGMACRTPCTLQVKRKRNLTLDISKDGYKPVQTQVISEIAGAGAVGMAGNVILGGIIGAAIDASTGSTKKLTPNPVSVTLEIAAAAVPAGSPAVSASPPSLVTPVNSPISPSPGTTMPISTAPPTPVAPTPQ